ncbi:MAG: hypothetical protein H0W20_08705 [Chthoniobacterales bacterium]|nr:hypothetical protein [Chthoniobacterales bacterium]
MADLPPGAYTAILAGKGEASGVGLVEVTVFARPLRIEDSHKLRYVVKPTVT